MDPCGFATDGNRSQVAQLSPMRFCSSFTIGYAAQQYGHS
jgi:hypothetical protein